jgi:hypothetical protein
MHLRPVQKGEELQLTNRWTRLRFQKDSDRVNFNDVEFRLSDRIPIEGGRFRVSQRDIDSLIGHCGDGSHQQRVLEHTEFGAHRYSSR